MSVTSSGPLVDQQHDQIDFGVIGGDRMGDVLQHHRLAGSRRRHDQARAGPCPSGAMRSITRVGQVLLVGSSSSSLSRSSG